MKKYKKYYVKWLDSQSEDGWILFCDKEKISDMIIYTVGYLIDETKNYIRLSLSIGKNRNGDNRQFNGTIAIPKISIIKMRRLK